MLPTKADLEEVFRLKYGDLSSVDGLRGCAGGLATLLPKITTKPL